MESTKDAAVASDAGGDRSLAVDGGDAEAIAPEPVHRPPFASLSQVDADFALARALQQQEAAFLMLQAEGEGFGSSDGSYVGGDGFEGYDFGDGSGYEDGEYAVEDNEGNNGIDGEGVYDDEGVSENGFEYWRELQLPEDEVEDITSRLMALAGLNDCELQVETGHLEDGPDLWQHIDPDELTYEELSALGDLVGTESRGLSSDAIKALPSGLHKAGSSQDPEQCVICLMDFEEDEPVVVLDCKHSYHSECINRWLQTNKACPVCGSEVSAFGGEWCK